MSPRDRPKRKARLSNGTDGTNGHNVVEKRPKTTTASPPSTSNFSNDPLRAPHPFYRESEENGIVLREYYPHEMSNDRARAYNADELPRPIERLNAALAELSAQRKLVKVKDAVVHWFKWDLRTSDNRALSQASDMAREAGVPLIGLYIISPQDFEAHLTAPVRVDFTMRTLQVLQDDLARLDIPLWVETVEKRARVPGRIVDLMREWSSNHLFANIEYEVDELRREEKLARMLNTNGMALHLAHDTCVVPPGQLRSGSGNQYAVYTPWFRSWIRHIHENLDLIELSAPPNPNPPSARQTYARLFACKIPPAPTNKRLSGEEEKRFRSLWPAGEREAMKRLAKFCEEDIGQYGRNRNIPSTSGTSSLSVHFASGTLSARTAVRTARARNNTKKLDGGHEGIQTWISEVAWRDFYKHVLVHWPYIW